MKELFAKILHALEQGENVLLCSILASSGSSPRGAGAKMAVFQDGSTFGTIGGGAVEKLSGEYAMELFQSGASVRRSFTLTANPVQDIGMVCGGAVTVYFQFLSAQDEENIEVLRQALALSDQNEDSWLITEIAADESSKFGIYDRKNKLRFLPQTVFDEMQAGFTTRGYYKEGEASYLIEPLAQAGMVYIFGGGHVGKALVPALKSVGFRVTVFDNRPDFAKAENYPKADAVILGDYLNFGEKIKITAKDYVAIMTPGHQADREVLLQVLKTDACYIGCIGSRNKIAKTNEFLLQNGVTQQNIDRIHAPIGLELFGDTPEEIAISITAEMIRHRALLSGTTKKPRDAK